MSDELPITTPPGPSYPVGLGGESTFIMRVRSPPYSYETIGGQANPRYLLYSLKFSVGGYNYTSGNAVYYNGTHMPMKMTLSGAHNADGSPIYTMAPCWRAPYEEFVKTLKDWFRNPAPDAFILKTLRKFVQEFIPVRSGNLATKILSSFFIERRVLGARCRIRTRYHYPTDYPGFIRGKTAHAPPDIGYGKHPRSVAKGFRPPNVTILRTTKKGAYYLLNDPRASKDLKPMVNAACAYYMQEIVDTFFNNLLVIIQL